MLNDPVNFFDPMGLTTSIITISDYGFGTHSAVYADNNGSPFIYDPAGSYGGSETGSGDLVTSNAADINSYMQYHLKEGSSVNILSFNTTPEQEAAIFNRADAMGGGAPGSCAARVAQAINDIGPFKGLTGFFTPGGLQSALKNSLKK